MDLDIRQVINQPSDRYPWTHRVSIYSGNLSDLTKLDDLTEHCPGVWANDTFYTTSKVAMWIALKAT